MFRWITTRIVALGECATWVVGGIGESQQIKKGTLNFEGKASRTITHHRLCPTIGDDMLSSFWATMIAGFTLGYDFDICLVVGVLEIPRVNAMREARQTFDIILIHDAANLLARPMRQETDVMEGAFPQDDQTDVVATTKAIEMGKRTDTALSDIEGCMDKCGNSLSYTHCEGSGQTLDVTDIQVEIAKIKVVSTDEQAEETEKDKREKKKKRKESKAGVDIVPPPVDNLILVGTVTEESGTRSKGPHIDIDAPVP
ncbi:hypothetical protein FXO38_17456 [Capsicum annuum]|nr:hypothetical protein FXO38_17456 [Capsicum annuum]KAF3663530.1 hypothetical protein FXO37_11943 [Capsicum annuum]